jgi:hypothetical protein
MQDVSVDISGRRTVGSPAGAVNGPQAARWALTAVAALAGAGVGLIGSFCHRDQAVLVGHSWPVGLGYAFAGLGGLLLALAELPAVAARWWPGRLAASVAAALGWLVVLLWVTYLGPPPGFALKGDVILANDWISITYLIGGMALATTAVYRSWLAVLELKLAERRG